MTLEVAQELGKAHPHIVFISDIRSGDGHDSNLVAADMKAQALWHSAMNARHSLLKFRLPWTEGGTEYLRGQIMLPIWGPHNTTECRLIVRGNHKTLYDHRRHWEQMCHFNRVARGGHSFASEELDDCFDCRCEKHIWKHMLGPLGEEAGNVDYMSQFASRSMWTGTSQRTIAHRTGSFF
jgi:cap2 methyltransferase